ncbi:FtsH protease activity modulator HflK [Candidatus Riesia pediculicola]|uniref:FtsH protease activity modulator HflK n=1 Tax=Candidatus Riesia pediculicola TaxID=401619 RepID=UPI0009C21C75|nr:FtsH protease activity modulator HflK [Candidatus Riesia pediculicola]ARC54206.1 hypothetical protein AOE57_01140 [Candidatus Riesia pediculicola]
MTLYKRKIYSNFQNLCNLRNDQNPWDRRKRKDGTENMGVKLIASSLIDKLIDFVKKFQKKEKNLNQNVPIENWIKILFGIILISWIISGFYTIKESDRGVILRFGKYHRTVEPGLNWKYTFAEKVVPINVETIREQVTSGMMLTSDENVIQVEMNVQYRIKNPSQYLFNVIDPENSLRQAVDSAVRGIIGLSEMEKVLTIQRAIIRDETKKELENIIRPYEMGISILDVNFQTARPPEAVKASFDDVIAAREEEQKTIREAQAYRNEVIPIANGNSKKLIEEAIAYKTSVVLKAKGEIESFSKILPEYKISPKVTRERIYIETMERVFDHNQIILIDEKKSNIFLIPYDSFPKSNLHKDIEYRKKQDNFSHLKNSVGSNISTNIYDYTENLKNTPEAKVHTQKIRKGR